MRLSMAEGIGIDLDLALYLCRPSLRSIHSGAFFDLCSAALSIANRLCSISHAPFSSSIILLGVLLRGVEGLCDVVET